MTKADVCYVGVDLGATSLRALAVDGENKILAVKKIRTLRSGGPGRLIQKIAKLVEDTFVEAGVTRMIVPYVPVTEPVIEDARRFVEAWGKS